MGLFNNFFNRSESIKKETNTGRVNLDFQKEILDNFSNEQTQEKKSPITVFAPKTFKEVEQIINALKESKTCVVHLTAVKMETAIRILDMLSGAVYALGGGVYEMQKNIFMFSPNGVEVNQ